MNGPFQGPSQGQDQQRKIVATGGDGRLSTLYDAAVSLLTGESLWRAALAAQIGIEAHDTVLDIGCGAGALCLLLARMQPGAEIIGIDPRGGLIAQARIRAGAAGLRASFIKGDAGDAGVSIGQHTPTRIVLTLTGALSATEKLARLQRARQIIDPAGVLHVVDHGAQRTALMQRLFAASSPRASTGDVSALIRAAGFVAVEETAAWPTPAGVIALHRARAS